MKKMLMSLMLFVGVSAFADLQTWFAENAATVESALNNAGQSQDGVWSATSGGLDGQLSVIDNRVVLDVGTGVSVDYVPNTELVSNLAKVTTKLCFSNSVDISSIDVSEVQAGITLIENGDGLSFAYVDCGSWLTDTTVLTESAYSSEYMVEITINYDSPYTVDYVVKNSEGSLVAEFSGFLASSLRSTKMTKMQISGSGMMSMLSGERALAQYSLNYAAVPGVAMAVVKVGGETIASGNAISDCKITEGSAVTIEFTAVTGYIAPTTIQIAAMNKSIDLNADYEIEALPYVAKLNGTDPYASVQAAVNAATMGDVLTLEKSNLAISTLVFADKTMTLDLNGYDLSANIVINGGALAINAVGGCLVADSDNTPAIVIQSGSVVWEDGTLVSLSGDPADVVFSVSKGASLTISGGEIGGVILPEDGADVVIPGKIGEVLNAAKFVNDESAYLEGGYQMVFDDASGMYMIEEVASSAEEVDPGEDVEVEADDEDAAKAKVEVSIPDGEVAAVVAGNEAAYKELFKKVAVNNGGKSWTVRIELDETSSVITAIQNEIDGKNQEINLVAASVEGASIAVQTVAGLYYNLFSGTDPNELTASADVLGNGAAQVIDVPNKGVSGFYRLKVGPKPMLQN